MSRVTRGIVSPAYTVLFAQKEPSSWKISTLSSWSRSLTFRNCKRLSYGVRIGQWELRFKDFKDVVVPYPSVSEQPKSPTSSTTKPQQIDELIRAKERKIELLGEYRASLIHQAVTKGLDPNVEMKPSGARVDW